ncbi:DUF6879 family protein [Streptomyces sp. NPDC014734]|uniref:DUF6879 family protein n=1 Tax=Streptomyces sp. NPDC014734 TaxID=3364886 RepID=UPI0036FFF5A0
MSQKEPIFAELLAAARHSAVRLEMRDSYGVGDEAKNFEHWRRTGQRDVDPASAYWAPWVGLLRGTASRGGVVRRAHVMSEPISIPFPVRRHARTTTEASAVSMRITRQLRNTCFMG